MIDPGLAPSAFLGGSENDHTNRMAVDGAGNAYVTGYTASADFPTTAGAFDTTLGGPSDAFVTKLGASGATLAYSTSLGGISFDEASGIAVDSAGNAYVAGYTYSPDFPTTAGAFDTTYNDAGDAFVTKLSPGGSALGYSTYLGGGLGEGSQSIAVDGAGSAYLTGGTTSLDFPTTPGAFDRNLGGDVDVFVTKLDASGATLGYSTYLGGSALQRGEYGSAIMLDGAGNVFVTGETG